MKKILFIIFLSIYLNLENFAQNFVTIKGREFIDKNGKPFQVKSVGLGFWLMPEGYWWEMNGGLAPRQYFDLIADMIGPEESRKFWKKFQDSFIQESDLKYIKSLGLNTVRIPFDYRLFTDEYYLGSYEPRGFELFDKIIGWCKNIDLNVILDMHAAPGSQAGWHSDDGYVYPWLFEDNGEVYQKQTIDIWKSIAKRYANETIVIGYELLNEPLHQYYDTARLNPRLEIFYKKLTKEIREVNKNHIIFITGSHWNRNFDVLGKPYDSKLAYAVHLYNFTDDYTSFDYFVNFSKKYQVPLWLSEFGEYETSIVDSLRTLCDLNQVSWSLWSYKKMNNNHCLIQIKKPDFWDEVTKYSFQCYKKWIEKLENRPSNEKSAKAFQQLLENMLFQNCIKSEFYLKALNLKCP